MPGSPAGPHVHAMHGMRPPEGGWPQAQHAAPGPAEAGMFKRSLGRAFRLRIEPE